MSRIGRMPVPVPEGVSVKIDGSVFHAKGPLGELSVDEPTGDHADDLTTNVHQRAATVPTMNIHVRLN